MKNRKKILHLITGLEIGGAETMLLKTLPNLQRHFDNYVCSIIGMGPIGYKLRNYGIPVYQLDLHNRFDWRTIRQFRKIVHQIKPEILTTYLIHADLFGRVLGRAFGIKKIVCSVRVKLAASKYLPLFLIDGLTSPLVNRYHFNSPAVARFYQRCFFLPSRKIKIIPNGIDLNLYTVNHVKKDKRKELNLPATGQLIGCVARLRPQKGHRYLLPAFALVLRRFPAAILLIIGDGEEKKALQKMAQDLGIKDKVYFLGNRHDVGEILPLLDVFVLSTLYEGMSNSLMEAMAAARAIVTSDIPENRDLFINEESALLVNPRKPAAVAEAIIHLLAEPGKRQQLGEKAREVIRNYYDIGVITPRFVEFYESI